MLLSNVMDFTSTEATNSSEQFCPLADNEEEAYNYAIDFARGLGPLDAEIVIGHSITNKKVTIIDGPARTVCIIPCIGAMSGLYEIATAAVKTPEMSTIHFGEPMADLFSHSISEALYNANGELMYQGKPISSDNLCQLRNTYVFEDSTIYDATKNRQKAHIVVHKNRDSAYNAICVVVKIVDSPSQRIHHLVYSLYNNVPLDVLKILTRDVGDWCSWYMTCDFSDIVAARTLRTLGKEYKWAVDHIDTNTYNNNVYNLQLCTFRTNVILDRIRKSKFKMID